MTTRLVTRGLVPALMMAALAACSTPEEKAANAQRKVSEAELEIKEERLRLIEQYKACVDEAAGDRAKADECDRYLKAIEALK